jgi:hypothetical protein
MTHQKNINTDSIKQLLNQSVTQMDAKTIENLRDARNRALEAYRVQQKAPALAWLHHHGILLGGSSHGHKYRYLALALIFSAILFSGTAYWQQANEHDHSEIDIAILTDDLPVDAYVD